MSKSIRSLIASTLCLCATVLASPSSATVLLSAVDQGTVQDDGTHFLFSTNYAAGNDMGERDFRNFFVFDLSSLSGNVVTSASLDIFLPDTGYASPDTSETLGLFDVSSASISSLIGTSGTVVDVAIYDDLGTGADYGSAITTESLENSLINFALSAAAIAGINDAIGSLFAVGGDLITASVSTVQEVVFGNTQEIPLSQTILTLETTPTAVAEPSILALLSLGLAGLGFTKRRMKA